MKIFINSYDQFEFERKNAIFLIFFSYQIMFCFMLWYEKNHYEIEGREYFYSEACLTASIGWSVKTHSSDPGSGGGGPWGSSGSNGSGSGSGVFPPFLEPFFDFGVEAVNNGNLMTSNAKYLHTTKCHQGRTLCIVFACSYLHSTKQSMVQVLYQQKVDVGGLFFHVYFW